MQCCVFINFNFELTEGKQKKYKMCIMPFFQPFFEAKHEINYWRRQKKVMNFCRRSMKISFFHLQSSYMSLIVRRLIGEKCSSCWNELLLAKILPDITSK